MLPLSLGIFRVRKIESYRMHAPRVQNNANISQVFICIHRLSISLTELLIFVTPVATQPTDYVKVESLAMLCCAVRLPIFSFPD